MVSIERAAAVASYVNVAIGGGVWLNGVGLTNALDLASRAMQPSVSLPTCPSAEELQALASGDLPPDVAARIEQHVAGCSRCSGVMETVSLAGSAGIAATSLATACTQPGGVAATIDYHGAQELPPEGASAKSNNNLLGGRYRLGEFIARGGMGTVHRATDELFQRQVAVKLLLGVEGRDSSAIKSAADRFRYEAAVTARLQHPGIPPVHDLSLLADGSPFLAMKLIEGRTLAELLAERKFPQDELTRWLHIFEQIAQTVGYAHAQGVIHRDLKPHNVMVGAFGEVQVMDWGLAKELGKTEPSLVGDIRPTDAAAPDDPTERTQAGAILGTPAYMAPEQARGETDRLDSRADVFALGAMLCQILTGGLPYSGKRSAELIAQASAGRLEYGQAQLQASGADPDIVSLAIHCLAPLAADRPATGAEVAAAVAQHRATVESRLRQAETDRAVGQQRLIEQHKRRRVWIGLAAVLLFGVLASTLLAIRAEYQRGKAVTATADAIQARLRETAEKEAAQTARDLARSRYMLALDAFDEMVFGIQEKLNTRPGTLALRQDLLSNARNGLQKLMQEAEKQGAPDHTLVWSHLRMGDVELALGNTNGAHQEFLAGHLLAQKLAAVDPRNAQAQRDLSVSFEKLGNVAMQLGQTDEALRNYQQSLEITQRIATVDSRDAQAQHDLSVSFDNLGNVNLQLGQTDEAVRNYQQSLEIRQRLAATDPRNAQTERDLSVSFDNLGNVTLQLGQTDEALRNYQRSLEIRQRLAIADGQNAQAQRALSTSFESLGDVTLRRGQTDEALRNYQQSLEIRQRLAAADPQDAQAQRDLSLSFNKVGNVILQLGQTDKALRTYQQGLEIRQRLAAADPRNAQVQRELSISLNSLGNMTLQLGQTDEALRNYQQSLKIFQRLAAADPRDAQAQRDLSISFETMGNVTLQLGRTDEALRNYQPSLEIRQRLAVADPRNAQAQRDLSFSFNRVGDVTLQLGQTDEALRNYQQSLEIRQRLVAADPGNAQAQRDLSISFNSLGNVTLQLGQTDEALRNYQKSLEIFQRLAAADPRNAQAQRDLLISFLKVGKLEMDRSDFAAAIVWLEQAVDVARRFERPDVLAQETKNAEGRLAACRLAEPAADDEGVAFAQDVSQVAPLVSVRLIALLKRQETAAATATAERFAAWAEEQEEDKNHHRYDAACFLARCAAATEMDGDALVDKVVEILRKAQTDRYFGGKQLAHFRQNADFAGIREHAAFAAFVKSLTAVPDNTLNAPTPGEPTPPDP